MSESDEVLYSEMGVLTLANRPFRCWGTIVSRDPGRSEDWDLLKPNVSVPVLAETPVGDALVCFPVGGEECAGLGDPYCEKESPRGARPETPIGARDDRGWLSCLG